MWTLIGVYNYILYTGDVDWMAEIWPRYVKAMTYASDLVGDLGIVAVNGTADWARWLYSDERASASML